jgi:hypothetical protein
MNLLIIILLSFTQPQQTNFNVEPHQILQMNETNVNCNYDEID